MSSEDTRRQQLIEATERVLRQQGAARTTIAEIAREAELSVGAVYLYFTSKDAILEALAQRRYDIVLDAMTRAASDTALPFQDRLRAALDAKVQSLIALADEGAHSVDMVHCVKSCVQSAFERFHSAELVLIAGLLAQGRKNHAFEFDDADAVANTLLDAYACFAPPCVFRAPRATLWLRLKAMHRLTLFGLVPPSPLTNR